MKKILRYALIRAVERGKRIKKPTAEQVVVFPLDHANPYSGGISHVCSIKVLLTIMSKPDNASMMW